MHHLCGSLCVRGRRQDHLHHDDGHRVQRAVRGGQDHSRHVSYYHSTTFAVCIPHITTDAVALTGTHNLSHITTDAVALTGNHNHKRQPAVAVTRTRTRNHKR